MRLSVGRVLGLVIIGVVCALVVHVHRSDAARDARLGEIASAIAGRRVEVHCPSFWRRLVDVSPNEGTVGVDPSGRVNDYADLSMELCGALQRLVDGRAGNALACLAAPDPGCREELNRIAWAVEVLTHESYHLSGILDEGKTECYALQTSTLTSRRLGLSERQAEALATYYLEHLYPLLPAGYHSPDCRPGGALDLHSETAAWPSS